jgi:hypothetical protein
MRIFFRGLLLGATLAGAAQADSIIKHPGDHPRYVAELEPRLIVGFVKEYGNPGGGLAVGFRATFPILFNGFIKSINNSVGIGTGIDVIPERNWVTVPVVMQWNFWLASRWSVFGEPGFGIGSDKGGIYPIFSAGGRYHFTERIALTLRLGYPSIDIGVSFFL